MSQPDDMMLVRNMVSGRAAPPFEEAQFINATNISIRMEFTMTEELDDAELMRIKIDAEDFQDTYGVPRFQDYTDMCGQRGVIRKLAADVLTLLKAMGIEVEDARDG